ncbi:MAG: D-alanyl-D-alanine carboxypeptidase family protein [Clostridiales bacterium]|nr:D-alanyl-D-alanine carboxypeptidase family protein [Clostridiales bacterium]
MRKSTKRLLIIDLIILMLCLLGAMAYMVYRTWYEANEVVVHEQGSEIVRERSSEIGQYEFEWDGKLESSYGGGRTYTLKWSHADADYYKVCLLAAAEADAADGTEEAADSRETEAEEWEVVAQVDADEELKYTTPLMDPFTECTYKVIAVDVYGNEIESNTVTCEMEETVIYATIWPVKDLTAYSDSGKSSKVGKAGKLTAYCVLGEENGMFEIMLDGETCYISSDYCMINLPDYIGDMCEYDITNSYSSFYTIHDCDIPDVTWTVIEGYENVKLSDGSYLVPLLYPTAQKLLEAAQAALEDGYRIKIYDSYRPQDATKSIYSLTYSILYDEIESYDDGTTYRSLMYGDSGYQLSNFLAKKTSTHNYGIAMDLTLVDVNTGKELAMQTYMHDLSWYSAVSENNESADLLAEIMTAAGFGTLESEWWHFQDNDSKSSLDLSAMADGVSAEGWMADDGGWKYRLADGTYYTSCLATIDGESYTFDGDGYVLIIEAEED